MKRTDRDTRILAPTGVLRATINLGNPILARQQSGQKPTGLSVDLATALAERLNVPLELLVFDGAAKAVEAVSLDQADIGFFAIDPLRSQGIAFTAPYVVIEGCYLVKEAASFQTLQDVDQSGVRVVVGKGSAYDLFLTRTLQNAEIVRAPTSPSVIDVFLDRNLDVAAGVKQQLCSDAKRINGLRLLPEPFMLIQQAMGLPSERGTEAISLLGEFLKDRQQTGFVLNSLRTHGIPSPETLEYSCLKPTYLCPRMP